MFIHLQEYFHCLSFGHSLSPLVLHSNKLGHVLTKTKQLQRHQRPSISANSLQRIRPQHFKSIQLFSGNIKLNFKADNFCQLILLFGESTSHKNSSGRLFFVCKRPEFSNHIHTKWHWRGRQEKFRNNYLLRNTRTLTDVSFCGMKFDGLHCRSWTAMLQSCLYRSCNLHT